MALAAMSLRQTRLHQYKEIQEFAKLKNIWSSAQLEAYDKGNKMASIKENAMAYQPKQTKNISEMEVISTDVEMKTKVVNQGEPDEFSYEYIEHNGEEYRVPKSVIMQLQEHLKAKPKLQTFKVSKKGEGLKTEYTVIPLE